ncbi:AmmeMemoRadiSam system radical SAM enzyme [Fusibacter ferrireducens]|uniref:AmmeMemoRadiSam system radical SAM enzyme n=1 Tax=Fusibacter ferrireducens TaxID=2785058 RepID=A0ABR9ZQD4_9FIRM|nr:AmmeMemoRadiSam system radical SAM enzyme [Fusibacter ferrireducens]MBF4692675.1 AmmeMemoRadiSam system radical SAM enzyme [Fusibacter ferrireducens]
MKEALFYKKLDPNRVSCLVCPHLCIIPENETGKCQVRKNIGGILYSLNYGQVSALAVDPIEKKPLHFWRPESQILSVGSYGCNMSCQFCQNFSISQYKPTLSEMTPKDIVQKAKELSLEAIAYTYNEPTVFYEMVLETAMLAKQDGIANVLVTNGFINPEPLAQLMPYIDAANVDVKTYDHLLYGSVCEGNLDAVLSTIQQLVVHNIHVEVTCLLVPGLFEDLGRIEIFFKDLRQLAGDVPLHLSRYYPRYLYKAPATDLAKMREIQYVAQKFFSYAQLGNVY